jgi:non-specific protein-tyrosine kinase
MINVAETDLQRYLRVIWRWLWLIVLAAGLAAGASYRVSDSMPRIYRTSVTLMVGENIANPNVSFDDINISQRVASGYQSMARRQPVLEATVKALDLPTDWHDLQGRVLVSRGETPQLLEIRVVDSDPERARDTADEIARQLTLQSPTAESMRQLEERRAFVAKQVDGLSASIVEAEEARAEKQAALETETSARGVLDLQDEIKGIDLKLATWRSTYASLLNVDQRKSPSSLAVVEPAFLPSEPISPNVRASVMMATAVGAGLAVAVAIAIEVIDGKLAGAADVSRALGLPILGEVPRLSRRRRKRGLVTVADPYSAAAEAYRMVRTNVQFVGGNDGPLALLVTSPSFGEGKTFTTANLAAAFAQAGRRTILVDADLRRPALHSLFDLSNEDGLTSLLGNPSAGAEGALPTEPIPAEQLRREIEARLLPTSLPGLSILPSGPPSPNPAEALASPRMEQILRVLQSLADVVLLDSPPAVPVADAAILAAHGPTVLLVVRPGRTRGRTAAALLETLGRAHSQPVGVVLNAASISAVGRKSYPPASREGSAGLGRVLRVLARR